MDKKTPVVFTSPLFEPISEIEMSISQTIFNLRYIYHAMLMLRAFLFQKGISCYSGVMVAHSSGKQEISSCGSLGFWWGFWWGTLS